ncbi:DUF7263 family protein [Haloarchaeobius sp. DFWS5]|uniref:DUF7263 family protein n=1 Tax=Haloarchaeobius sp. DFWS5 TaxID=3446114 RepID=UPI003EBFA977
MTTDVRGQANLVALGIALLALTSVLGVALAVADGALAGADREPGERRLAVSLSNRLVAADGPVTRRGNVLDADALDSLDTATFEADFPVAADANVDVRVRIDDRTLVETGAPDYGSTVRRIVLVERERTVALTPPLDSTDSVTLPRRTDRVAITVDAPPGTNVTTVRANGRIVLRDPAGLDGNTTVTVSRFETTTLSFETTGNPPTGSVELTYYPTQTTKGTLVVTVDA